jgi:hypothetical protein
VSDVVVPVKELLVVLPGGLMIKLAALETGPSPLRTVIAAVPAAAMSAARIAALNVVALINVVVRLSPFHLTREVTSKLDPATKSVKAGPPASADFGLIPVMTGAVAAGGAVVLVAVSDVVVAVSDVVVPVSEVLVAVTELVVPVVEEVVAVDEVGTVVVSEVEVVETDVVLVPLILNTRGADVSPVD